MMIMIKNDDNNKDDKDESNAPLLSPDYLRDFICNNSLILTTTLWIRYYYYPHFIGEETKPMVVEQLVQGHTTNKWQSWD